MIKSISQLVFMYLITMLFVEFVFPAGKRFLKYIYWSALLLTIFVAVGPYVVRIADDIHNVAVTYSQGKEAVDKGLPGILSFFKGGLKMPMIGELTKGFNPPQHHGIDIAAPQGTIIQSAGEGKVTLIQWNDIYGNMIVIDHGNGIETLYGHLQGINIQKGYPVIAGTNIGTCGSTGNSTGPHLHLEVRANRKSVNPAKYLK